MKTIPLSLLIATVLALGLAPVRTAVAVTSDPTGGGQSHENHQPGLGLNYLISTSGAFAARQSGAHDGPDRFLGEITMFAGNFEPRGWAFADGQVLPISTHKEMFSFLGTTYGGDGRTTVQLPDLRGRSAMHFGNAPGLSSVQLGQKLGVDNVSLSNSQIPSHDHPIASPIDASSFTGGGQSHTNMKPTQAINYFMPETGGDVRMAGFSFTPNEHLAVDGQFVGTGQYSDLLSVIGTTYGGDGNDTFGLPDLRGRIMMHEGQGTGLTNRTLGSALGVENVTLTESTMPTHGHGGPLPLSNVGSGLAHENMQPTTTLNYIIATQGDYPSDDGGTTWTPINSRTPFFGEVRLFAGDTAPAGWAFADGQSVLISSNPALFSLLGTTYGGDGEVTFKLPDMRGRVPVHVGDSQPGAGLRVWSLGEKDGQESVALTLNELPVHTHSFLIPGDLDDDGFVGIDDLNLVLANWNQNVPPGDPLADPSGDGFVGIDDLNEVLGNWNAGSPPPPGSNNIPEPASLMLLGLGSVAMTRRRQTHLV